MPFSPSNNPLSYVGLDPYLEPVFIPADRLPTVNDIKNPGTRWQDNSTSLPTQWYTTGAGRWYEFTNGSFGVSSITGTAPILVNGVSGVSQTGAVTLSLSGPYSPVSFTAHTVLIGEGTSAIGMAGPGTDGQVLTGNTGADPTFNAIGTKSGLTLDGIILGGGAGPFTATTAGLAGQILTSNGAGVAPTFQTAGGGTTSDYADFYALMPGDNAATVMGGAPIELPNNGPSSGTSITRLTSTTFQLADIATYSVSFQCSFDEAGQMQLAIGGVGLAYTVSGRATGTNQVYINALVTTSVINEVLSVINPAGNSPALTITPIAGGTHAVSAHLVIQRVAGGAGGGLLNAINSVIPVAGNINITAGNGTAVTPGAGIVTVDVKSGGFVVTPVAGTSQAMLAQHLYIANNASLTTFTLPTTSAVGDVIEVLGSALNTGGWKITYTTGQIIWGPAGSSTVTTGNAASAAAAAQSVTIVCVVANTTWVITANSGTIILT